MFEVVKQVSEFINNNKIENLSNDKLRYYTEEFNVYEVNIINSEGRILLSSNINLVGQSFSTHSKIDLNDLLKKDFTKVVVENPEKNDKLGNFYFSGATILIVEKFCNIFFLERIIKRNIIL